MKRTQFVKLVVSSLVMGTALTSCAGNNIFNASSSDAKVDVDKAPKYAEKARTALSDSNLEKALHYGELAVASDNGNAEYRSLLGQVYMLSGRFNAAERTFLDVIELGQVDARTVLSLSMTELAQNKAVKAITLVRAHKNILPIGDYGLALALAGETKEAVKILSDAIRGGTTTPQTRQNLALAYALDGPLARGQAARRSGYGTVTGQ